jgi:hypothetical protein
LALGARAAGIARQVTLSSSWDLIRFQNLVRSLRSPEGAASATAAAHAIAREFQFAAFHAQRSTKAMKDVRFTHAPADLSTGMQAVHQLFSEAEPGEKERPLLTANFQASADLVASLRSLHAATDILGPVVYFGLGLNERVTRPPDESRLYPTTVRDQLVSNSIFPEVASKLSALLDLAAYDYLRAFVNTTKHRELVSAGFIIEFDFSDDPSHGLQFGRFRYKGRVYEPKWSDEFFKSEFSPIAEAVVAVGVALNDSLQAERDQLPPAPN